MSRRGRRPRRRRMQNRVPSSSRTIDPIAPDETTLSSTARDQLVGRSRRAYSDRCPRRSPRPLRALRRAGAMSVAPAAARARGERARGVVHHALDAQQDVDARLVSTSGAAAPVGAAGARRSRDRRRGAGRAGRDAGDRLELDALVRIGHDLAARSCRQRAAGHAVGRRVVVVAEPDAADEVAGEADEPGVAIGVGGAGLARAT